MPGYQVVIDTQWIYPPSDTYVALQTTTGRVERLGSVWVFPTVADFITVMRDIYLQTAITQPTGNQGYSLGVGTYLEDLGKEIRMRLATGEELQTWRLVRQITPQEPVHVIPTPGNSPAGTVGWLTTATAWPSTAPLNFYTDTVLTVRC